MFLDNVYRCNSVRSSSERDECGAVKEQIFYAIYAIEVNLT